MTPTERAQVIAALEFEKALGKMHNETEGAACSTLTPILTDIARHWFGLGFSAATKAERERCAKVCDAERYTGYVPPEDGNARQYYDDAAINCAAAIRG